MELRRRVRVGGKLNAKADRTNRNELDPPCCEELEEKVEANI